ncbi:MAG: MFS transporter [Bdellovibrionota bacterium]
MFTRSQKILLAILATVQFNNIVDFMIMMPLNLQLTRVFQITPHQFGLLVSSYTFFAAGSGLLSSLFIDRFDRKKFLQIFFFGFSVGTIACGLSQKYEWLLFFRCLTGVFGGVLSSLVMAIVSDTFPYERRGTAMGVVMTAFSFASVFGVPFSLYLAERFDWHAPFYFLGGVSLIVSFLISRGVPSMKSHMVGRGSHDIWAGIKLVFHSRQAQTSLVFLFCLIFGQFVLIPFMSASLVINAGLPEPQLPLIYITGGLVSIVTGPLVGYWADKFGKHKVFTFALLGSIPPMVMISQISHPLPLFATLTLVAVFFVFMGGRINPAMALVSASVPATHRGSFMSLTSCVQQLGSASASYAVGLFIVTDKTGHLLNYEFAGYLATFFSFCALFLVYRITAIKTSPEIIATVPAPVGEMHL